MNEATDFFNKIIDNISNNISCCMLGRIETYNAKNMTADVLPLHENSTLLINVPVSFIRAGSFFIRAPYKKGDIVLIVFCDKDIENILLSGNVSKSNSSRKHSLDDAIVVGGIMPLTKNLPEEHLNDLVIAKDNLNSKIIMKENGDIEIKSNTKITVSGPTNSTTW